LVITALFVGLFWLSSCRSGDSTGGKEAGAASEDANSIVAKTMGHFRAQTYSATVNIAKVYKGGARFDDVLRLYSKFDGQDHARVLMSIKPQEGRSGAGMLAEVKNNEIVSASRLIPETKRVVQVNTKQQFANVVIGGLSIQDFQMLLGVSPFSEVRVTGREKMKGKMCDALEVVFSDQSQYHHGQLYTTVGERLPVLLRAYTKEGTLLKEIVFDRLEPAGDTSVIRQLTVIEWKFDYTSTFKFENVQVNAPVEDSVFTNDFLQKGWQEPS
jgi:hypothetical protein